MTTKRNERKVASKNEDLVNEDAELKDSHEAGEEDHERQRELDLNRRKEAERQLLEHDLNAENGPKGAAPHQPLPPYWGMREEGEQEVTLSDVEKAQKLIERCRKDEERIAEKRAEADARKHDEIAQRKQSRARKDDQATPSN